MTSTTPSDPILFLVEACGRQIVGRVRAVPSENPDALDSDIHGYVTVHNPLVYSLQPVGPGQVKINLGRPVVVGSIPVMKTRVSSWFLCPREIAEQYAQTLEILENAEITQRSGIQLAGQIGPQDLAAAEAIRKMKVS